MSTPATFKKIEEAKKKVQKKSGDIGVQGAPLSSLTPLSKNFTSYRSKNTDFTEDRAEGRQYTSFENRSGGHKPYSHGGRGNAKLDPQIVLDIPAHVSTDEYTIAVDKLTCFDGANSYMSEFYRAPLSIDGHDYPSVEHYYQACKLYTLAGSEHALKLKDIEQPFKVKIAAKRILASLNITKKTVDDWKATHGFIVLNHANVHKFVQNLDLRKKLLDTGDSLLAHAYTETFFACGLDKAGMEKWVKENAGKTIQIPSDLTAENVKYIPLMGKGKNLVGVMLMHIRKQLLELDDSTRDKEISIDPYLPTIFASSLSLATTKPVVEKSKAADENTPPIAEEEEKLAEAVEHFEDVLSEEKAE